MFSLNWKSSTKKLNCYMKIADALAGHITHSTLNVIDVAHI